MAFRRSTVRSRSAPPTEPAPPRGSRGSPVTGDTAGFTLRVHRRQPRRLELTRAEFRVTKNDSGQNLFLYRARLFAATSIDRSGFYPFLLDTGSEPTLMTSGGMGRAHLLASPKFAPKEVVGIGKSSMEWWRLGEVALGLSGFGVRFKDILVQENDTGFECGIVGSSFLKNFRVRLDFARMPLRRARDRAPSSRSFAEIPGPAPVLRCAA